jgi:hypothetical protein
VANSAVAARAAQAFVDNVVGPGITLLPKITSQELKAALLDTWNAWTDVADVDGLLNFYGLQALAARMMFIDGEVFVRFTADAAGSLRLQLLPAEFIDTTITRDNVIAGVEFDSVGRRTAFYIYEWHPGNLLRLPKSNRVPSTEVLQIFRPAIPGQVRGVSALLPIMQKLNDLDQFDRATLVKQKTGALLTGFITTPNENPLGAAKADDGTWTASLEPGTIQRLSPGESLEFSDPPDRQRPRFALQHLERRPVRHQLFVGAGRAELPLPPLPVSIRVHPRSSVAILLALPVNDHAPVISFLSSIINNVAKPCPNLGSQGLYNAIGEQIRRPGDAPGYLHGKKLLRWPTGVSPKLPGSVPSAPMN